MQKMKSRFLTTKNFVICCFFLKRMAAGLTVYRNIFAASSSRKIEESTPANSVKKGKFLKKHFIGRILTPPPENAFALPRYSSSNLSTLSILPVRQSPKGDGGSSCHPPFLWGSVKMRPISSFGTQLRLHVGDGKINKCAHTNR